MSAHRLTVPMKQLLATVDACNVVICAVLLTFTGQLTIWWWGRKSVNLPIFSFAKEDVLKTGQRGTTHYILLKEKDPLSE